MGFMLAAEAPSVWKRCILPTEHGVWGLLAGAALVGLPLAGDLAGLGLLVAALAAIVARQAATAWASGVVGGAPTLAVAALVGLAAVLATWSMARSTAWWPWAAAMLAVGGIQQVWAWRVSGRPWQLSALAGLAFALLAGAVAAAGGAPTAWVIIAVVVLAAHVTVMVPLVRAQTRRDPCWAALALDLQLGLLLAALAAWAAGLLPWGIPFLFGLGLARVALTLDKGPPMSATTAARIGTRELAWLAVVAAGVVLTLRAGA